MFINHMYLIYMGFVIKQPSMFDMTKPNQTYEQFTYKSYV